MAMRDGAYHNVLTMPGERPGRVAIGAGFVTFLSVLLIAGGDDVFANVFGWNLPIFLRILQVLIFVLPPLVALLTYGLFRRRAA